MEGLSRLEYERRAEMDNVRSTLLKKQVRGVFLHSHLQTIDHHVLGRTCCHEGPDLFVMTNKNVTPGAVAQRRPRQQSEDFRRGDESFEREAGFAFEQRE